MKWTLRKAAELLSLRKTLPRILDFRGIHISLLHKIVKELQEKTLAPGITLFETIRELPGGIPSGCTICVREHIEASDVTLQGHYTGKKGTITTHFISGKDAIEKLRKDWTFDDIAEYVVLPSVSKLTKSAQLFLNTVPEVSLAASFRGIYVIHAHQSRFMDLVQAIQSYIDRSHLDISKQYVWLDVLCSHQPLLLGRTAKLNAELRTHKDEIIIHGLEEAIAKFNKVVVFLDSWHSPNILRRKWCLWEIFVALRQERSLHAIYTPDQEFSFESELCLSPERIASVLLEGFKTLDATCWSTRDEKLLTINLSQDLGSAEEEDSLSLVMKEQMQTWYIEMISYAILKTSMSSSAHPKASLEDENRRCVSEANIKVQAAMFFRAQGMYEEGTRLCQEALDLLKAMLGPWHEGVADTLASMAKIQKSQKKHMEAFELYREAISIVKAIHGSRNPKLANLLMDQAGILRTLGKLKEAENAYNEALGIRKSLFGDRHVSVGQTQAAIASLVSADGRHDQALQCFETALTIFKESLGSDHLSVSDVLLNIGKVQSAQDKKEQALETFNRVLKLHQGKQGIDHERNIAITQKNIGLVYHTIGRYNEALECHEKALHSYRLIFGPCHCDVAQILQAIAVAHHAQGKHLQALKYYAEALEIARETAGAVSAEAAVSLNGMAAAFFERGEFHTAQTYHEEALRILQGLRGEEHPSTCRTRDQLRECRRQLSQSRRF